MLLNRHFPFMVYSNKRHLSAGHVMYWLWYCISCIKLVMTRRLYLLVLMWLSHVYRLAKSSANQQGFGLFVNPPILHTIPCPRALIALSAFTVIISQAFVALYI